MVSRTSLEDANFSILCEVDSNPSSDITLVNVSDNSSIIMAQGVTEIRYTILSTSCQTSVRLKCLAENTVGKIEQTVDLTYGCKNFFKKKHYFIPKSCEYISD